MRLHDAGFTRHGTTYAAGLRLSLSYGETRVIHCTDAARAALTARLAAGIVKATEGSVLIGEFDPAVQPVQAKRLAGFASLDALPADFFGRDDYLGYRAALWNISKRDALRIGNELLARFAGIDPAYALALAGALLSSPPLAVLDRPPDGVAQACSGLRPAPAILCVNSAYES